MKKIFFLLLLSNHSILHAQNTISVEEVIYRYSLASKNFHKIEYHAEKVDTVPNGPVRSLKGYALIERDSQDSVFGVHFYGHNYTKSLETVYDGRFEFEINKKKKTYVKSPPSRRQGILGMPGALMIAKDLFSPDIYYQKVALVRETPEIIVIKYEYPDDIDDGRIERQKLVELDRSTFLPRKVTTSDVTFGKKGVRQIIISHLKKDSNVKHSLKQVKLGLANYTREEEESSGATRTLIGCAATSFSSPELFNNDSTVNLPKDEMMLLVFWDPWCSPCVSALSNIEVFSKKNQNKLHILRIVTDDPKHARKLIRLKNVTFTNLVGNESIVETYNVLNTPKFVLIDKNGIIVKEYIGWKQEMDTDLAKLLTP